ncbi:uncharacterized protein LOC134717733 [Mytilus trossulus]|uniref:uncharacterized protein LOC134717733 n=1 Tax=Mytilus trossulus TaxID=6551 RepID=UPI00300530B0
MKNAASCYKFVQTWDNEHAFSQNDNSWCKTVCKEADAKYQYSGTYYNYCYCRETEPSAFDKVDDDDECYYECPGNNEDMCGGYVNGHLLTVSKIDRTNETVTKTNTQGTSATAVSTRVSAMTEFMNMITNDTSSALATEIAPYITQDLSSTTSGNANNDISPVSTETSTRETTDRTTETVTEKNTQTTSTPAVSTRASAMTEFTNMITSDKSSVIATKSAPYTTQELSSTATQKTNNDISSVMTETSTQAITDRKTETATETKVTSATSVSTRDSAMTEFMNMITNDTSSAIATEIAPYITQDLSSTTSGNANYDMSLGTTEESTQATTDRKTEIATETKATSATSVSTRDSAMTEFMNMITNDTSSAIATEIAPYTTQVVSSTTSGNANNDISLGTTEESTQATTGISTETEVVKNKEATTVSIAIRESTTTDVIRMITRDTSPFIVTQSTHGITQEELSTTTENIDTAISTVMTETASQTAIAEQLNIIFVEVIMPACKCSNWNSLDEEDTFYCNYQASASEIITIACQPNTRGRFVRIKWKDMESLTIREVDVNGDQVNSTNDSGLPSTAHACDHSGYGYTGPIIGTSVASSYIDCTMMCFTITACAAAEYDKKANVCTLKSECTNTTQ